jgi:hypothetical protein
VRVRLNDPPSVSAGGPYSVAEGSSVTLTANGSDPEGGSLAYAWDLDNNGTFETPGQSVSFSRDDGPASPIVKVRATDDATLTSVAQVAVAVTNVAPTATFGAPASSFAGFSFTLSLTSPHDVSAADTAAGFSYAFDCGSGSGYGPFGAASSVSCPTTDVGPRSVRGKIRDKDGDVTQYTGTVRVVVTFDSLCSLVRAYSTKVADADALCAKLADAAATTDPATRAAKLSAFRNQVDAKTGKSLTQAQADELKLLSRRL